jgi:hypothetical protein
MVLRMISELAGGDPGLDGYVSEILSAVIAVCYQSKVNGFAEKALQTALELVTNKDWLLTVQKTGNAFEFEAKFGDQIKTASLRESNKWLAEAGTN